jgi:nicotinamide mononucleotide transporter
VITDQIIYQFVEGLKATTWHEYLAVFAGIASVWFSRKEHILVYPVGLVNTVTYVYLSAKGHLFGEVAVNVYYTVMSLYGWVQWSKTDAIHHAVLPITASDARWRFRQILFFLLCYVVLFVSLRYLQKAFFPGAIPWADALAGAAAFTGMWLMTHKKVEHWIWWILTNVISIPLYFVKHYVFSSVYYLILLVMAVFGFMEWKRRLRQQQVQLQNPSKS